MTTAPDALWRSHFRLLNTPGHPASYVMAGIVGDAAHSFGYHLAYDDLPSSDYSLRLARDLAGGRAHPDLAAAWDLSFSPADMILVTKRLIRAARERDPRLVKVVREFCGTTNGSTPHPYDVATNFNDVNNTEGWSSSHVSHVHISYYRDTVADFVAIRGVVDIICGIPAPLRADDPNWSDRMDRAAFQDALLDALETDRGQAAIKQAVGPYFRGTDKETHTVERTLAHVVHGTAYASDLGRVWPELARRDDLAQPTPPAAFAGEQPLAEDDDLESPRHAPLSSHAGPTNKTEVTDDDVLPDAR